MEGLMDFWFAMIDLLEVFSLLDQIFSYRMYKNTRVLSDAKKGKNTALDM